MNSLINVVFKNSKRGDKYKSKRLPIKTVILDQGIITGIGNIYADEILFLSKINPYTINSPLEIEHIDGDYRNNTESNLVLLCPNCHSLTSTYKGANVERGRKSRSKYYIK